MTAGWKPEFVIYLSRLDQRIEYMFAQVSHLLASTQGAQEISDLQGKGYIIFYAEQFFMEI